MFIKQLISRIRGEKRRKKVEVEIEELKKAILEDPKFRDEILRELEYRTGRRDLLKVGALTLLGFTVGTTRASALSNQTISQTISDYTGVKIPKPCTAVVAQDGTGDYDVSPREDASEVIQKAIDYAHSKGGGEVRIKSGGYLLEQTVRINKGHVCLVGEGWNTALLPKGTKPTIHIRGIGSGAENHVSDIILSNFKIHSNRSIETDGILLEYTHSVKLDNLFIHGLKGYAVKQVEDWELRATRISISQCGDASAGKACWIATKSSKDYTNHAEFFSVKIGTQFADGIHITYGTHQMRFNMCKFVVWGGNYDAFVVETPNDSPTETREIMLELCQFETAAHKTLGSAIRIYNVKNMSINNCNFGSKYSRGIVGKTNVGWVIVSNSHFIGLDVGIDFNNRILIVGNYFVNCKQGVIGGGYDKNIVGNSFYRIGKEAIRLINPYYSNIENNHIIDYSLESNGTYDGIYLWNPHFCNVRGNYVVNRDYKGKYSIRIAGNSIEETIVKDNYVSEGVSTLP